jgi:glycogen phosphorylase
LRATLDLIASGVFSGGDSSMFLPLVDHLLYHDTYLLLADYRAYVEAQSEVDRAFRETPRWTRMSILNVARAGKFSSDRSIREYCEKIWDAKPAPIRASD